MKRKIHISECNDMDTLAEDIFNQYGAVLLPQKTELNAYIIQKLMDMGIEYISVSERTPKNQQATKGFHIFEKKYKHCVNKMKHLVVELIRGGKVEFDTINSLAESIISIHARPEYIIQCLSSVRDTDDYTYYHCINVSLYAMLVAGWLNLTRCDIQTALTAGLLHDVGKSKIPGKILNKTEKLTFEEFEMIKRHTVYGYELLKDDTRIADEIKDAVLMHHERENHSGYPLQKGGNELGIHTKIVAVADVYDAMTSNRPYKKAKTPFEAFEELLTICVGTLDVHVTDTLVNNLSRYYVGSKVLLSNGQTGAIAYIPPHSIWKPIVDTGSEFLDLSGQKHISILAMV